MKRKSEDSPDRSIFLPSEEEEQRIRRERELLDREMRSKIDSKEKDLESTRDRRAREEEKLAQMKAAYLEQVAQVEAEAREKIVAGEKMNKEALNAGRISFAEYVRIGVTPRALPKMVKTAALEQLSGLVAKIREKADEIIDIEIKERTLELDIIFLKCFPGQNEIARLKARVNVLEAGVSEILGLQPAAFGKREQLEAIRNERLRTYQWGNLDEAGVMALLLDPKLPAKYLDSLGKIIVQIAGTGELYQISWASKWDDVSLVRE